MTYDQQLEHRLDALLGSKSSFEKKQMFGGIAYLINGNMCVGVHKEKLVIRVGIEKADELLKKREVRPMDITGRVMNGWAFVLPKGIQKDSDLKNYVALAEKFVKSLPRKKKRKKA